MKMQKIELNQALSSKAASKKRPSKRRKKLVFTVSSGLLIGATLAPTIATIFSPVIVAKADVLNIEILSNITSGNDSGTSPSQPYAAGTNQKVNFTISGTAPVEARVLSGTRYAALVIPNNLREKVTANGSANGQTSISVDLKKLRYWQIYLQA